MVTVMSKMVAMMAVRNGGDALGYGDDDGNNAMAVRLMTAMMAMTLWKRTFPYLHACRYGKGSGDTAKRNKLATLGSSSTVHIYIYNARVDHPLRQNGRPKGGGTPAPHRLRT